MSGRLVVRATRVGTDTVLAQIAQLVSHALATKAGAQRLADRVAAVFVPCVISLAVVTLGFWLGVGLPGAAAWSAAIAVLVVACPCALGLATPTALLAGLGRGAELGILVKSAQALEAARHVRAVVLDKTGTLTTGHDDGCTRSPRWAAGTDEEEVLLLAGAVEDASEHPVGQAIARGPRPARRAATGHRLHAACPAPACGAPRGRTVTVGNPQCSPSALAVPVSCAAAPRRGERRADRRPGRLGRGRRGPCWSSRTRIRPGSAAAVARMRRLGLPPC